MMCRWCDFLTLVGLAVLVVGAPGAHGADPEPDRAIEIGSRKQLLIDDRFITDRKAVELKVNSPVKAGAIDVEARTVPSIVERDGVRYLYQRLNGATSAWTSTDGIHWTARGQIAGADDAGEMWTTINSVFVDPKDAAYSFKGLCERTPKAGMGEIWLEIQDAQGQPIAGFSRADAVSIDRNGTAQEVWWQGGPDVSDLVGRSVWLRFVLPSAKLFAFQFDKKSP